MSATDLAAGAICLHCGLPAPEVAEDEPGAFCCSGCRTAYAVLNESGLEHYYDLPERRNARVEASGRSFAEFDHPSFCALYVRGLKGGLSEVELYIEGVHCASCVWLVERVPLILPGMASAELNIGRGLVRVVWDPARVALSAVAAMLDRLGYRPHPFRGMSAETRRRAEDRAMIARIGVAGAIAGNVMLAALAIYSGWLGGMEHAFLRYFRWVSLVLVTPAMLWPARVFFRGALGSLKARTLHMDVPIAFALAAGYVQGVLNTIADRGPIYFDGVAMLIFLLLVGRFLQQRAQRGAHDSAELLYALSPSTARIVEGDQVREIPTEALIPGMVLEVRPGDTIAADGVVLEGGSRIDVSLLTGESRPVPVAAGDRVYAGTLNRVATLRVRAEQAGEQSRLGRILREIGAASARRAPVARLADRLAGGFVAVVLVLAAATALLWLRIHPVVAFDNAIALLIVTCPCALALATPLALTVAIGRAARQGILIKGGDALEILARPGVIVLDKTGTLTEGKSALVEWEGPDWARPLVLALEGHSTHPIAEGFAAAWPDVAPAEATDVRATLGGGVEGEALGHRVLVGSPAFVRARVADEIVGRVAHVHSEPPAAALGTVCTDASTRNRDANTLTPVLVAVDGRIIARAGFGDEIRADAAETLAGLRARGYQLRLLSGDDPAVVAEVGRRLGFASEACRGGVSPEEKLRVIEESALTRTTIMVGDGVNDATAIARASVGVGVRGGAEASLAAADVFLARPGLSGLVELVDGAQRTLAVIRRNIAFSLVYNLIGAALAISGVINPLIAAILMPLSSITVVLASWRSRTFGVER